jgi:CBS domain containing-hemolysin-like protein
LISEFAPLPVVMLQPGAGFAQPAQSMADRVTLESPALEVMTDLCRMTAVLVRASDTVVHARERMRNRGVRMLLCVDASSQVEGLITLTDILGERPVQVAQSRGIPNLELLVRDIMTPQARLEAFAFDDVAHARVGHVVESLKRAGRQHALVVEIDGKKGQRVRGVFSVTQIARQLGVTLQTTEVAHTFAEIEATLAR